MIREVHVYGRVEKLQHAGINNAQHRGLGTQLVNRACELASPGGIPTHQRYQRRGDAWVLPKTRFL